MFTLTIMATIAKADMQNNGHNFPDGLPCSFLLAQNHGQDDKFADTEIASITRLERQAGCLLPPKVKSEN
jgi:hypothetical protein